MGRKKRDLSYLKPFCYYCDKVFNDEIILHQHQKAKHFTCDVCKKKFSNAIALVSHKNQAHRENIQKVPKAIPGRESIDLVIVGMQGVPRILVEERIMSGAAKYWNQIRANKRDAELKVQQMMKKEKIAQQRKDKAFDNQGSSNNNAQQMMPFEEEKASFQQQRNERPKSKFSEEIQEPQQPIKISLEQPISFNLGSIQPKPSFGSNTNVFGGKN